MPSQHCIDVRLFVDDQPLIEHALPGESHDTQQLLTRYVEVKAGQRFTVRTRIEAGFKLHKANAICSALSFDQSEVEWCQDAGNDGFQQHNGILVADVNIYHGLVCVKNDYTGEWEDRELCFGAFGTNDNAETKGLSTDAVSKLGCIQVDVHRAHKTLRKHPRASFVRQPDIHHEAPEHMLKGKSLKNIVEYGARVPRQNPAESLLCWYDTTPITGRGSMMFSFVFLYRNREILQHIGVIPRSPTPEPDVATQLARTEEMMARMKIREKNLTRQIKQLQADRKHTTSKSTPWSGRGYASDNTLSDEDADVTEITPPPEQPRVFIDLTGDD